MAKNAKRPSKELKRFVAIFRERPEKVGGLTKTEKEALVAARQKHSSNEMAESIGLHYTSLNRYIRKEGLQKKITPVQNKNNKAVSPSFTLNVKGNKQIFINGKRTSRETALKTVIDVIL